MGRVFNEGIVIDTLRRERRAGATSSAEKENRVVIDMVSLGNRGGRKRGTTLFL